MQTYQQFLKPRAHFPLPFADRKPGYLAWRDQARMERRVEGSRHCG